MGPGFESLIAYKKQEVIETSCFLYAPGIQGTFFYFPSQKRSIPFRLAALRDRSRSHTHFAPIRLHLRKASHAGAVVLIINFQLLKNIELAGGGSL